MSYSSETSYSETPTSEPIFEFVLALGSLKGDKFSPGGACTIIGNYLAVTAKHVIEEDFRRFEGKPISGDTEGSFNMHAVQLLNNGKTAALWSVVKIYMSNHTDIAFLKLLPANSEAQSYQFGKRVQMNLNPPKKGERLSAFGYRKSKVESRVTKKAIKWGVVAMSSRGCVTEVHQNGFTISKYPCIQADVPWENRMSGGPIFNEKGQLCAIISKSLWEGSEHVYSVGALLWPSMSTILDLDRTKHEPNVQYQIIDLCEEGYLSAEGWENIYITKNEDEGTETIGLSYDI